MAILRINNIFFSFCFRIYVQKVLLIKLQTAKPIPFFIEKLLLINQKVRALRAGIFEVQVCTIVYGVSLIVLLTSVIGLTSACNISERVLSGFYRVLC